MKLYVSLFCLFLAASPVAAQDIALSQILIDGESWQRVKSSPAELLKDQPHVVAANGFQYSLKDAQGGIRISGKDSVVLQKQPGLRRPAGITLWPDGRTLVVGDAESRHLWAFRVEKDGTLTCPDGYYALRVKPGETASGVTALTVDDKGLLYASTPLGVQVFDPTGRLCGVLTKPEQATATAIWFDGPDRDQLFIAHGDELFARKIKAKGVARSEK